MRGQGTEPKHIPGGSPSSLLRLYGPWGVGGVLPNLDRAAKQHPFPLVLVPGKERTLLGTFSSREGRVEASQLAFLSVHPSGGVGSTD